MNNSVRRKKLLLGFFYGLVSGFAFAFMAWGIDAWLLARANASYFWIKIIPGLIICMLAGGLAGCLTIYFRNHLIAMLLWALLALLFSWLVVWLPLINTPSLLKLLNPNLVNLFKFSEVEYLYQYRLVGLITIGLAAIIGGLLEINLVDQATLSPYISAFGIALLVCLAIFGLAGSAADQLININLREPIRVIDELIQFAADNEGKEVPKQVARKMHLSAVNNIRELLQRNRQLILIGYDTGLGQVDILVDFEGSFVKCTTIYSQPTDCVSLNGTP